MTEQQPPTRLTRFERGGLTFELTDRGPLTGDLVVLLHGFPQDSSAWDAVASHLHEAGLRTLAPNQRGYSPRARPSGRAAYRMRECALDTLALLDAAGARRAHVVGHDWGGAVAWTLAGHHPDRVRSAVVISTPHPAALTYSFTHSTQAVRSWYMGFFQLPWLPERLIAPTLHKTLIDSGLPVDHADRYCARMRADGALSAALGWYRAMPWSWREPTPRTTVPTAYIWGRRDFALGRAAAEATRAQVRGPYRFVELEAGHWLPETRPEEVASVIRTQVRSSALDD